jgi:hypothetical protein
MRYFTTIFKMFICVLLFTFIKTEDIEIVEE